MRSPYFTDKHHAFRMSVRQFMEKEVAPHAETWEKNQQISEDIWRKLAENNLLGIPFPEKLGGTGADFFSAVAFWEELSTGTPGGFSAAVSIHQFMVLNYIERFGSQAVKDRYVVPGIRGEKIGALAVTEPAAGSNLAAIRTRAVRKGNYYTLNGAKTFVTNGLAADFLVVAVKTDPDAGAGGITLMAVDRKSSGLAARKLPKSGWQCVDIAELTFDDVKIPVTQRIGKENEGFYYLMECFPMERLISAIIAVAGAQDCLDYTLRYIAKREPFQKPLGKYQVIRHNIANLATAVESARQMNYAAAWRLSQEENALMQCTMAKLNATELYKKVTGSCMQYFGGYGVLDDFIISGMHQDARVSCIFGGSSEMMREIISRGVVDGFILESNSSGAARPALTSEKLAEAIEQPNGQMIQQTEPVEMPAQTSPAEEPAVEEHPETVEVEEEAAGKSGPDKPENSDRQAADAVAATALPGETVSIIVDGKPLNGPPPAVTPAAESSSMPPAADAADEEAPQSEKNVPSAADIGHNEQDAQNHDISRNEENAADAGQTEKAEIGGNEQNSENVSEEANAAAEAPVESLTTEDTPTKPPLAEQEPPGQIPSENGRQPTDAPVEAPVNVTRQIKVDIDELIKATENIEDLETMDPLSSDGNNVAVENNPQQSPIVSADKVAVEPVAEEAPPEAVPVKPQVAVTAMNGNTEAAEAPPQASEISNEPQSENIKEQQEAMENASGSVQAQVPPKNVRDVFLGMPERFRKDRAGNYATSFHFKIRGGDGGEFTVNIASGNCQVQEGLVGKPRCIVETTAKTYMDMELGKTNAQVAFMMGKVKVSSVPEMMQFAKLFRKLPDT